ncbi:hypothetical protein BDR07DRAFT_1377394 [Suillus spraguei]|nr:hypothetical protein BDR07DRAFT_1377394 [Suillus spraguei]
MALLDSLLSITLFSVTLLSYTSGSTTARDRNLSVVSHRCPLKLGLEFSSLIEVLSISSNRDFCRGLGTYYSTICSVSDLQTAVRAKCTAADCMSSTSSKPNFKFLADSRITYNFLHNVTFAFYRTYLEGDRM